MSRWQNQSKKKSCLYIGMWSECRSRRPFSLWLYWCIRLLVLGSVRRLLPTIHRPAPMVLGARRTSIGIVPCLMAFLWLYGCATGPVVEAQEDRLPVSTKNGSIHYEEVVTADSKLNQQNLFRKAKQWIAQNYVTTSNYNPIQLDDVDNGVIIGRIFFKFSTQFFIHQMDYTVFSVMKLQVKDGKYKYTFTDFTYVASGTNRHYEVATPESCDGWIYQHNQRHPSSGSYTKALIGLDNGIKSVIASLQQSLNESDDF